MFFDFPICYCKAERNFLLIPEVPRIKVTGNKTVFRRVKLGPRKRALKVGKGILLHLYVRYAKSST